MSDLSEYELTVLKAFAFGTVDDLQQGAALNAAAEFLAESGYMGKGGNLYDKGHAAIGTKSPMKAGATPSPQPNVRSPFELRKRIMFAIFDPGASEGFNGVRDLTTWQTDAVMKVIREDAGLTPEEAWQELCETPDVTSPEEYPDHALITIEQLADYMRRAATEGSK